MAKSRKQLNKEYRERNKEKIKEYSKKNAQKQKEAGWPYHKKRMADLSEEEREKINAKQRVENKTEKQKEKARKRCSEYYYKNREARLAYQKERRKEMGDELRERANQRAKDYVRQFGVSYRQVQAYAKANQVETKKAGRLLKEHLGDRRCNICTRTENEIIDMGYQTRRGLQVDHIDGDGKNYELSNLQYLCWVCNTTKLDMPTGTKLTKLIRQFSDLYHETKEYSLYDDNEETDRKP